MLNYQERAERLQAALAKSIAESIKYELRMIVLHGAQHEYSGVRRLVRQRASVTSFGDLHDYLDANMLPPQSEWLLDEPLVKQAEEDAGNYDGQQLAVDVLNAAQDEVDGWIKDGGLADLGLEPRKDTEPYGV